MSRTLVRRIIEILFFFGIFVLGTECGFVANRVVNREVPVDTVQKTVIREVKTQELPVVEKEAEKTKEFGFGYGDNYLLKYLDNDEVQQVILVEQSDKCVSEATLYLFKKDEENHWKLKLACNAFLGKNGIDKVREGDKRTPTGDYGFLMAFGVKENPGALIPYTKLTNTMYLCGDRDYYNQFVDISKIRHSCGGNSEHLIRYVPQYNYSLFIDYNKEGVYGKGSAIFLHCCGNYPYTLGCVGISEENMIKILRSVNKTARICIYPKLKTKNIVKA